MMDQPALSLQDLMKRNLKLIQDNKEKEEEIKRLRKILQGVTESIIDHKEKIEQLMNEV